MPGDVSIVIPCYNVASFIAESLDSVRAQTTLPCEVICVDDGSQDNTKQRILDYAAAYPLLGVTLINGNHRGAPAARNSGLQAARGEFIQFLDSDDLLDNTKIERQLALIQPDPDVGVVSGSYVELDPAGDEKDRGIVAPVSTDPWINLIRDTAGVTSANMWRRSHLLGVGGWDERLPACQEYDLMFRMLLAGHRFVCDFQPGTQKRWRPDSIWGRSHHNWQIWSQLKASMAIHLKEKQMMTERRAVMLVMHVFNYVVLTHLAFIDGDLAHEVYERIIPIVVDDELELAYARKVIDDTVALGIQLNNAAEGQLTERS